GADWQLGETEVIVHPLGSSTGEDTVALGNAGTVARFTPALAALGTRSVHFDGDPAIRRRPMAPLLRALTELGVDIEHHEDGGVPFTVHGKGGIQGGTVELDSEASSQFLSALLLIGPRCRDGLTIRITGAAPPSEPNIAMTRQTLQQFGATTNR